MTDGSIISDNRPLNAPANTGRVRVAVVDDSITVRTIFGRMVDEDSRLELVGSSASAEQAVASLAQTPCDVLLLDLQMPGMGGLRALPQILDRADPPKVLVISALTHEGAQQTMEALDAGAADTMLKPLPSSFDKNYSAQLTERIVGLATGAPTKAERSCRDKWPPAERLTPQREPLVVGIGASTGGISAINTILRSLPDTMTLPIAITQHLPMNFIDVFARQIESVSGRRTQVVKPGLHLAPGEIVIAPGNAHMVIRSSQSRLVTDLDISPARSGCMPSVDTMLTTLAVATRGGAIALILSGMGRDGVQGAEELYKAGGTVLAQDPASSSVWGMPRAVCEAGVASKVLSPPEMAQALVALTREPV